MKPKTHNTRHGREGLALATSMMLVLVLTTVSYAFFRVAYSGGQRTDAAFDDERALLLADAALHEGFEALRGGATGEIASMAAPAALGGGVIWVEAFDFYVDGAGQRVQLGADETRLVATALVGAGRAAVEAVLRDETAGNPLFQATLNSKETLTLNADVLIDSYDSSVGTYASQAINVTNGYTHANMNGDARSNEDIVLNARATLLGDAIPGPGHIVNDAASGTYISGSTTPALEPFLFPPVVLPSYPPSPAYSVPTRGSAMLPSGNYEFPSLTINREAKLVVQGPANIVVDDFTGGKLGSLVVDATNGPVTITVRNTYSHISGFTATPAAGSPMALAFMVEGTQDVVFPSNTEIRGAYYAPNTNILFASGNECWGAFAAKRISMSNTMRFHFDENLLEYWKTQPAQRGANFDVLAWSHADFGPDALLIDRRDPIQALGLQGVALRKPADAWVTP